MGDAIQWAAYTKNRISHKSLEKQQSPVEILFGKPANRENLRPFGQQVMVHVYKDQRENDRMAARAVSAKVVGYTKTHGIYQVVSETGKRALAKNPRPINDKDDDEEDTSEWPTKPVQDLEDIANGHPGRNYGWHCPEKEACPKGSHVENQPEPSTSEISRRESPEPDSPSQQLFREQEPPSAPQKPVVPEPRRSERMGRDITNWQERIGQGLAGGINRVGHDDDHPTDEQARSHPTKAHE